MSTERKMTKLKMIRERPLVTRVIITLSFILVSLIIFTGSINFAFSQPVDDRIDDPSQAEIPVFDFNMANKSFVVLLEFTNLTEARFVSSNVSFGLAPSHIGDPPLLRAQILDNSNKIIQEFNHWHPLWTFVYDDDTESLIIQPNATGAFIFPFDPIAASMKLSYLPLEQEVVSIDLIPAIQAFCEEHPQEPDCMVRPALNASITASLSANPQMYTESCPAHIEFNGTITDNIGNRDIVYRFIRSDSATSDEQILHFDSPGSQTVSSTWDLGDLTLLPRYKGWQAIEILSPVNIQSSPAEFEINCTS
jgi:hypothetical protein